ncbi:MAG: hypothetical protein WCP71_05340 [Actinomycetes bacterium]
MGILLKAKRGGAVPSAIFFTIFFTLLSLAGSVYLSVGIGNPVNKVTNSLLSSATFKADAGNYFVSKALETATGDERALLLKKGPQISAAVTAFLGNPVFKGELGAVSDIAYNYYTGGTKARQSIDVKPILQLALLGFESVDPQFSKLSKELNKIKPIKLQPQTNGPDASQIKSYFTLGVGLLLALSVLTLLLYLLFAKSLRAAIRVPGIILVSDGLLLVILNIVATAVVKHQADTATESLAREAIPIAAHSLISPLMTTGVVELLLGVVLLVLSYSKRVNVNSQR